MMKKFFKIAFSLSLLSLVACDMAPVTKKKPIVVLYENDVHCAIDGYAKLAGLRDAIKDTADVLIVSSGDFLQGGAMCAISRGEYAVDIMNSVKYDVVGIGNHEMGFSMDRLLELSKKISAEITNAHFTKTGSAKLIFKPYVIKNVGGKKIAFVGVLTPETVKVMSHAFDKDSTGVRIYDLHEKEIYELVQNAVDAAKKEGADYVIALSHLGEIAPSDMGITSIDLIKNTKGINAVLDGHKHSVISGVWVPNAVGDTVLLSQTGTRFSYVGKLDVDSNGKFHTNLLKTDSIKFENPKVKAVVDSLKGISALKLEKKLSTTSFDLTIAKNGKRAVRTSETNLGDLVADSQRYGLGAQIGVVNAGSVRADILVGDVTFRKVLDASPFFGRLCKIEATGKQIVDALEQGLQNYPEEYGGFMQVSGIRFEIDSLSDTKVRNVRIEDENGRLTPIDLKQTYTVALTSYVFESGGEITAFIGAKALECSLMTDSEILAKYFAEFGGSVPEKYRDVQGRITVFKADKSKAPVAP